MCFTAHGNCFPPFLATPEHVCLVAAMQVRPNLHSFRWHLKRLPCCIVIIMYRRREFAAQDYAQFLTGEPFRILAFYQRERVT